MTLQQFLLILRARARIACCVLLATVLLTLLVSLLLPKQYSASTAILIDVKPDPVAGVLPGMIAPGYMATQIDIIKSDRVAQRVVKLLHMDESPAIKSQWQEATDGKGKIDVWLANLLKVKLDVKPSRESNVIDVGYTGSSPAFAAALANAFAQAYVDVNLDIKIEPARQSTLWFEDQTKRLREKLEEAQTALSAYQQKSGVIATDERVDLETAKLNELSTELTTVQAQTSDSRSKSKSAAGSDTLSEVMQSPLINGLKSDIARLEAKLQESNINLGKNHPQTVRTETELATLEAKLAAETRRISSSIGTSYVVNREKEKELVEAIAQQKARVLDLRKQHDEIAVLKRDVESAQHTFDTASQRTAQTRLESLSLQTNVVILNPAEEPSAASKPKILLNLLVSVFVGTMLGVGVALLLEFANRRVRSPADLGEALGVPVLASISSTVPRANMRQFLQRIFARRRVPKSVLAAAH